VGDLATLTKAAEMNKKKFCQLPKDVPNENMQTRLAQLIKELVAAANHLKIAILSRAALKGDDRLALL
jgi:hypothetical protein